MSKSMKSMHDNAGQKRHDRHLRLAADLSTESSDTITRKFKQRILLTGDTDRLATATGLLMIRVAASLIARFCPKIDIALPAELSALQTELIAMLRKIDGSSDADFRAVTNPMGTTYAATLSIGMPSQDLLDCTVIDAAGWLAILGRCPSTLRTPTNEDNNPFGLLMASALGAAEVFKHLLKPLRPGKAFHFGEVTFSTFDYSVGGNDPGPALPREIVIPRSLLGGVGAVGNAFLLSLSAVAGLRGGLMVVDEEAVDDPSNLNRYLLAFEDDADPEHPTPKTRLATRLFENTGVRVQPFQESLDVFVERIYRNEVRPPEVVLSAVDNNDARLLLQKLWPDLLLEGATDHTLSQVSRHEYDRGLACLLCIHDFEAADPSFSYTAHMAELSGLSEETVGASLADASLVVTDEHAIQAAEEKRVFLSTRVGATVCSVLTELESISGLSAKTLPVQSTVSFVSMISGLLMAAELVKYAAGFESSLDTFFNIDSMFPLANAALQRVVKVSTCHCYTRASEIKRYREEVKR
jgi:ThiF family